MIYSLQGFRLERRPTILYQPSKSLTQVPAFVAGIRV
jgi:hypothetical protein